MGHYADARTASVDTVAHRGNAIAPANIRADSEDAPPQREQCALTAGAAARGQAGVVGIQRPPEDVVVAVARHDGLGQVRLAVEHGAQVEEKGGQTAVLRGWLVDVAGEPRRGVVALVSEAVLEGDREAP